MNHSKTVETMPLTREEWIEHKIQDERQSEDIAAIKFAIDGDPTKPETKKHALRPTMERLNTFLDATCFWWKIAVAVAGVLISSFVGVLMFIAKVAGLI